ncbi:MAG: hypothetical protein Unbinned2514contig1000_49 [Prokaryotic dsDNA virus sp.]|nr:MAG: hypothetical protein Unbinned2514contig1000_49 [Prokaryotic dsDNA virus sp.]|tara:strand:- start:17342 stop:17512 length:171 start_codon:yes stop_codon:yes gene_type:complete
MKPLIRILATALLEAKPFVWRAGSEVKRHEQDAIDAKEWLEKYGELLEVLKRDPRA